MAFHVWLTTHPEPGPTAGELSREGFFSGLAEVARGWRLSVARRHDGDWWLRRSAGTHEVGEPFCSAGFDGEGRGRLSLSLLGSALPQNINDLCRLAVEVAHAVRGHAVEAMRGQPLTATRLSSGAEDGLLRAVSSQARAARSALHRKRTAPLELPIQARDEVEDFLVWRLEDTTTLPELAELLEDVPDHLQAHAVGNDGAVLVDRARERGVSRLMMVAPHTLEITPYWSDLPFARLARETTAALERARARFGGRITLNGAELARQRYAEVLAHSAQLGCEFYEWVSAGIEPARWTERP